MSTSGRCGGDALCLRVDDIEVKRTQLLTTHAINLVTVQPKPGEIVVTIASAKRQSVSLWDLWAKRQLNRNMAGINTYPRVQQHKIGSKTVQMWLNVDLPTLTQMIREVIEHDSFTRGERSRQPVEFLQAWFDGLYRHGS